MTENMMRIQHSTSKEIMEMAINLDTKMTNREMVMAFKKVLLDTEYLEELEKNDPVGYSAMLMTIRLMRSCGENI